MQFMDTTYGVHIQLSQNWNYMFFDAFLKITSNLCIALNFIGCKNK